jgi:hypothetical protein
MDTTIEIAGRSFFMDATVAASERRKRFFDALRANPALLHTLPIEPAEREPYMSSFMCSTSLNSTFQYKSTFQYTYISSLTSTFRVPSTVSWYAKNPTCSSTNVANLFDCTSTLQYTSTIQFTSTLQFIQSPSKYNRPVTSTSTTGDTLTEDEIKILKAIGVYGEVLVDMAPHMAEFFDSLPKCSSDSSLMLRKDCDTAFYVLWSTLFAAQKKAAERLKQSEQKNCENPNKDKFAADIDNAQDSAIVRDIKKTFKETPKFSAAAIYDLFTIRFEKDPGEENIKAFLELMTLVSKLPSGTGLAKQHEKAIKDVFTVRMK